MSRKSRLNPQAYLTDCGPAVWSARNPGLPAPGARLAFYNKANAANSGMPAKMDTGQAVINSYASAAGILQITGGAMTIPGGSTPATSAAGYLYLDAGSGKTLSRVGARFRFNNRGGTATTAGSNVTLAMMNGAYLLSGGTSFRVGLHVSFGISSWIASKLSYATGTLVFTTLASGNYTGSLALDGTEYVAEVWRTGSTAALRLPDGTVTSFSDPDIANWSGEYGFVEPFEVLQTSDYRPEVTELWYDAGTWFAPIATAPAVPQPTDYSWKAWSFDPVAVFQGGSAMSSGIVYASYVPIPSGMIISNVIMKVFAAGSGLTSGQCFAAVYQNGSLLGTTADQSSAWASTGIKTMALSTPVNVAAGGIYVAVFSNGTTNPNMAAAIATGGGQIVNTSSFKRFGYDSSNTGRTTSFPATQGTLSDASAVWAAVS